jgi:hypothetical protein
MLSALCTTKEDEYQSWSDTQQKYRRRDKKKEWSLSKNFSIGYKEDMGYAPVSPICSTFVKKTQFLLQKDQTHSWKTPNRRSPKGMDREDPEGSRRGKSIE